MGTRGSFGVHINGEDKLSYCQYDSYPDGWPSQMVEQLRARIAKDGDMDALREAAQKLVKVPEEGNPTPEQIEKYGLQKYHQQVSTGADWYAYLRNLQGDLLGSLDLGLMTGSNTFIHDSLFCEYAYIVNLDKLTLEVYRGFQKEKPSGRYSEVPPSDRGFYACTLVREYPLRAIPDDWVAQIQQILNDDEDASELVS